MSTTPDPYPFAHLTQRIYDLEVVLTQQPVRIPVWLARAILPMLRFARERETAYYRLLEQERRYHELIADWNAVGEATRALGIKVYSPMRTDHWIWEWRNYKGEAPTAGEAEAAALAVLGTYLPPARDT